MKQCTKCGELKPLKDFCCHAGKKGGRGSQCKSCRQKASALYRKSEAGKASRKAYRHSSKGRAERKAYKKSESGRAANRRFQQRYRQTDTGREVHRRASAKYVASGKQRLWQQTKKGKASIRRQHHLRRAREKQAPATLTAKEWQEILEQYNFRCAYCGIVFSDKILPTCDHVIPVLQGGGLIKENVVPACYSCNARKGAHWRLIA